MFRKIERKIERFLWKVALGGLLSVALIYFMSQLPIEILLFLGISIFIILIAIGFRKIVWSSDKYVNERGYVVLRKLNELEHRWIAMQILNRELKSNEVVHHINGKKTENQLSNLCLMDRDKHEHFHSWLSWKKDKEGRYPSVSTQKSTLVNQYGGLLLTDVDPTSASIESEIENRKLVNDVTPLNGNVGSNEIKLTIKQEHSEETNKFQISDEMRRELFIALRDERKRLSEKFGVPPFLIFDDKTLNGIVELLPDSEFKMLQVKGVGQKKVDKYGSYFLGIIRKFKEDNSILE